MARIWFACAVLISACALPHCAISAATVAAKAFHRTASVHWDRVPLRSGLERLSEAHGVTLFLDRRVDPGQKLTVSIDGALLQEVLEQIARSVQLDMTILAEVVYVGPRKTTRALRTLAALRQDDIGRFRLRDRNAWRAHKKMEWPVLTSPRELISTLCQERSIEVSGISTIPHDLWPQGKLPPASASDQLTILLAGFDRTLQLMPGGNGFELAPITGDERIIRRHRLARKADRPNVDTLSRLAPGAEVSISGNTVIVRGRVEDHDRIAAALQPGIARPTARSKQPVQEEKTVYSLRVENQLVGPVVRQLAVRFDWTIEMDANAIKAAGISLKQRVSFQVKKGSPDDVLTAALTPAGLMFERKGKRVRVFPAKHD